MLLIKFEQDLPTGLRDIHVWKCKYIRSFGAQGHAAPKWLIRTGRNSNSSEILCISLLPRSGQNERYSLETPFPHYKPMGSVLDFDGHLTPKGVSVFAEIRTRPRFARLSLFRITIRVVYWWNAETTIIHQDLWLGKLVPCSHQRSEFSRWDQRIGADIPIPDSLGEEPTFVNIRLSNGGLKCLRVLVSTTPSFGNKVICAVFVYWR